MKKKPGTWKSISGQGAPSARFAASSAWTGKELFVWGGYGARPTPRESDVTLADGALYDPVADAWRPVASKGAPSARAGAFAAWTGKEVLVWGGASGGEPRWREDGALYDPAAGTWRPMKQSGAPFGRGFGNWVWTGKEMVVWAGSTGSGSITHGGLYDLATDTWTELRSPSSGQVARSLSLSFHCGVWTGSQVVFWGRAENKVAGVRFDPAARTFNLMSTDGAPSKRLMQTAVWSGAELLVWGGRNGSYYKNGARYDPLNDTWRALKGTGTPAGRCQHGAVWTGTAMLVWGGMGWVGSSMVCYADGGSYDPVADSWSPVPPAPGLAGRIEHISAWTDTELLVWGGHLYDGVLLDDGARYLP